MMSKNLFYITVINLITQICIARSASITGPKLFIEQEVSFENKEANITFSGTLSYPKYCYDKQLKCVVLAQGSGGHTKDQNIYGYKMFKEIGNYLSQHGIVVLRFDERGVGNSTGNFMRAKDIDFAKDAISGIDFLKTFKMFQKCVYGIVGHSKGAATAILATRYSKLVEFVVLLGGPGVNGEEILLTQSEAIMRANNLTEEQIISNLKINKDVYQIVLTTSDPFMMRLKLVNYFEYKLGIKDLKTVESQIQFLMLPWLKDLMRFNPRNYLVNLQIPVLGLWGSKDLQVLPDLNLNAVKSALDEANNKKYKLEIIDSLNHLFQVSKTGNPSEYPEIKSGLSKDAIEIVEKWINSLSFSSIQSYRNVGKQSVSI